ncbi:MAG: hypothetical protein SWC40_03460 [Thermodesulfobacteriota bacterium]|nr:hypothetical protein [Thermodesulfobacteriota bacterium]
MSFTSHKSHYFIFLDLFVNEIALELKLITIAEVSRGVGYNFVAIAEPAEKISGRTPPPIDADHHHSPPSNGPLDSALPSQLSLAPTAPGLYNAF